MYKVVIVGTDGSETANTAVESAAGIARALGAALHIVTAYKTSTSGIAQATGAALVDSGAGHAVVQEAAKGVGDEAIATYASDLKAEAHAVHADPVDAILDTAVEVGADLIVVGSKGMRGARRYIGSVPNSVAHSAHCAVLIVKTA